MNINNITLPYPVLGISDDILPLPSIPEIKYDASNIFEHKFIVKLNTNNSTIEEMIKSGSALYTCEVECRKTFYRECFTSSEPVFSIKVSKKAVAGEIKFTPTVVVNKGIYDYTNPGFHEDYTGFHFNLEPGDLLCLFTQFTYIAELEYDKLKAVSTFITINKTTKPTSFVDLDKPKIHLYLPENLYKDYRKKIRHQMHFNSSLHSSLALNALVYAILQYSSFKDTKWALTIKYRMSTEEQFAHLDIDNPADALPIAQLLLGDPYKRMFDDFKDSLQ